ncbi:vacuolar sorting-associated 8 -like protein, partial [Brachionus plicatilis]
MENNISINLDDLDDELLEAENNFESFLGTEQTQLAEPTIESILNEDDDSDNDEVLKSLTQSLSRVDSEPKARSLSLNTQQLLEKNGIVCKQTHLKQASSQLKAAIDRSQAGLPTALEVSSLIAIGTSRGLVLLFDSSQALKLYMTSESKDAISALSLNNLCDRLLVGDSSGLILMYDTDGRLLRRIADAHPAANAILNLKFTDDPKVAVFSDSGGSVFMLEFKRVMGVRSAESQCLFSGSRGEVCHIEPLRFHKFAESLLLKVGAKSSVKKNLDHLQTLLGKYSILAMASFTKLFIVALKPKLTVLFTFALHSPLKYLPILNWHLVILQSDESKRYISPMLTCARHSTIYFFQLDYVFDSDEDVSKKFRIIYSKKSDYSYNIVNFTWLNAKTIGILDESEKLHIVDIKSNEELQCLNTNVKLVYSSSFFKSLSTGGYVSEALAYAGQNSCYQTFRNFLGQLFLLGTDSITMFSLQNWSARIDDFLNENNLPLALDLAVAMHCGHTKALIGLPNDTKIRQEKICHKILDMLQLYVNWAIRSCPTHGSLHLLEQHYAQASRKLFAVCTRIHRQDILFNNVYDLITCDSVFEGAFYESLEDALLSNQLGDIPPSIVKKIIKHYKNSDRLLANLEKCLLHFNIANIDFHDVIQTCKKYSLTDAYIYLFNKALGDYVTPFEDVLKQMNAAQFLSNDASRLSVDKSVTVYGNKLLVYLHCCLCGQAYPYGTIDDLELCDDVRRTVFAYLTCRRNTMIEQLLQEAGMDQLSSVIEFPIVKIFLNFDVTDFLNVISMSFDEPSFEAVIGLDKKQHLIDILIQICLKQNDVNTTSYVNNRVLAHLFMFLARQVANRNNNIKVDDTVFVQ